MELLNSANYIGWAIFCVNSWQFYQSLKHFTQTIMTFATTSTSALNLYNALCGWFSGDWKGTMYLVSYPTRWSFSFILGLLHWSSIFPTSREHRNYSAVMYYIVPSTIPFHFPGMWRIKYFMASLMGLCCPANQKLNRETNGIKRVRRAGLQLYTSLCAMLYKYSLT